MSNFFYKVVQARTGQKPLLALLERALAIVQCKVMAPPYLIALHSDAC